VPICLKSVQDLVITSDESKLTPVPMPKVSNAFSLSTNDKVIENDTLEGKDNFTSEIMIKEEPLSENEVSFWNNLIQCIN
jgi:hypothetical protein